MHDLVLSHQRHLRLLLILSVLNSSILVIFWCLETAFQKSNWIASLITWSPQQIYLGLSIIFLVASLIQKSRNAILINIASLLFVVCVLMGAQFVSHKTAEADKTKGNHGAVIRVMQFDIDHWKQGASPVIQAIKDQHPDIFCLENSGNDSNPHYKQLVKAMPGVHFLNEDNITIGSTYSLTLRDSINISHRVETSSLVVARVYAPNGNIDIMAVSFMPCLYSDNTNNLVSYMPMYLEDRTQQNDELLKALKKAHKPFIFCCNLNAPPQTFIYKDISAKYKDAFYTAGIGYGYTYPSTLPHSRLDYIFASDDITTRSIWSPITKASSHCPVVADFNVGD